MSLTPYRTEELLARFAEQRILVVGDVMLDRYVYGKVERISPEAPVPVVLVTEEKGMPGGACNVALNVQTLGGSGSIAGVLGVDAAGAELKRLLAEVQVDTRGLLEHERAQTTVKSRVVAERQQVVRVDRERRGGLSLEAREAFRGRIDAAMEDATGVVIEDYGKGLVEQGVVDAVLSAARARGIPVGFDPKENHALNVRGIAVATPNRKEAFSAVGVQEPLEPGDPMQDESLKEVARRLYEKWHPTLGLLLTLGPQGMLLVKGGAPALHVPTRAREVFDVSGAGDTVIATCVLALAAGATAEEAAELSNYAAGVVVGKLGTAPCTADELRASLPR